MLNNFTEGKYFFLFSEGGFYICSQVIVAEVPWLPGDLWKPAKICEHYRYCLYAVSSYLLLLFGPMFLKFSHGGLMFLWPQLCKGNNYS